MPIEVYILYLTHPISEDHSLVAKYYYCNKQLLIATIFTLEKDYIYSSVVALVHGNLTLDNLTCTSVYVACGHCPIPRGKLTNISSFLHCYISNPQKNFPRFEKIIYILQKIHERIIRDLDWMGWFSQSKIRFILALLRSIFFFSLLVPSF